ncbi:preprotein translocase subunit SecE [Microlunatus speluncae]|uniref:preprotein translocase subunit SecE n=1 Tax=Microlunatus speluncae TaxID=2594267 RepID=UPI00126651E9
MADDKDKGPADEPDLSAGDPDDQRPESDAGSEPVKGSDADGEDVTEPSNEELAAAADAESPKGDSGDPDGDPEADDDSDDSDKELVAVGATAKTRSEGAADRTSSSGSKGREKKSEATPKQRKGTDRPRRTGPITFIKESVAELRKVVYPTGQQLLNYFLVVLVFVLFIIAVVSLLDLGFGALVFRIFSTS